MDTFLLEPIKTPAEWKQAELINDRRKKNFATSACHDLSTLASGTNKVLGEVTKLGNGPTL
jgi:hypothetical protein